MYFIAFDFFGIDQDAFALNCRLIFFTKSFCNKRAMNEMGRKSPFLPIVSCGLTIYFSQVWMKGQMCHSSSSSLSCPGALSLLLARRFQGNTRATVLSINWFILWQTLTTLRKMRLAPNRQPSEFTCWESSADSSRFNWGSEGSRISILEEADSDGEVDEDCWAGSEKFKIVYFPRDFGKADVSKTFDISIHCKYVSRMGKAINSCLQANKAEGEKFMGQDKICKPQNQQWFSRVGLTLCPKLCCTIQGIQVVSVVCGFYLHPKFIMFNPKLWLLKVTKMAFLGNLLDYWFFNTHWLA